MRKFLFYLFLLALIVAFGGLIFDAGVEGVGTAATLHLVIFALSNPVPEIRPEIALTVRDDMIMATGRSDYPNQVNNVLGFPFIFRGALDVGATEINDEMQLACIDGIAELARQTTSAGPP